ncbi:hypothetical protein SBRV1_gp18 [Sulfolobales Beppu rod-shaped virus 1]|uniref:Uncharacterized protein n=1 Tax=Sulfolobales Beppu rod-shaped virus 1 TaxID=2493121 RepID=A0A3Q8QA15_9VIRU|nr:hypothetical protein QIT32_gp18 [Sulfolobales Beppu rod-shaped virus 1]AZI75907.1 hypothetical protein SBRV1_gp18 [Sulfolobales Beppu rod-shaped virus 1]
MSLSYDECLSNFKEKFDYITEVERNLIERKCRKIVKEQELIDKLIECINSTSDDLKLLDCVKEFKKQKEKIDEKID